MQYLLFDEAVSKGYKPTEYQLKRLNADIENLKEFKGLCELIPIVRTSFYDDKLHFEEASVKLKYKDYYLSAYQVNNSNAFRFYTFNAIYVYDFRVSEDCPNNVGKPTVKKMDAWLKFLSDNEALKMDELERRQSAKTAFLTKVNNCGLPITNQSRDGLSGYIESDMFTYSFQVLNNGSVNEKIASKFTNSLDNFLKLVKK